MTSETNSPVRGLTNRVNMKIAMPRIENTSEETQAQLLLLQSPYANTKQIKVKTIDPSSLTMTNLGNGRSCGNVKGRSPSTPSTTSKATSSLTVNGRTEVDNRPGPTYLYSGLSRSNVVVSSRPSSFVQRRLSRKSIAVSNRKYLCPLRT